MISALVLAVALTASSPVEEEPVIDRVCGAALDRSSGVEDPSLMADLFYGRIETQLAKEPISDKEKQILRDLCQVYLKGAIREGSLLVVRMQKAFEEADRKSNPR